MEFTVNEQGVRSLSMDMATHLREIARLVGEIESQNSMLHAALGEDTEAVARTVRTMSAELNSAYAELNTIISDMAEYMSRVQQARVSLN